ncbi:MAG TPA: ROK family protein [Abditibacteriaceae bacterium]
MEIFGIDLGGTTFTSGAVDEHGAVSHHAEEPTRGWEGAEKLLPRLAAAVAQARETRGLKNAAVGIGVPGVVKHGDGICVYAPNLNGWNGLPVTQQLTQHLGIASFIINDANAAALAEARFGAGRGKNEVLVLTLGTGIGSGLVLDGKLRLGASERGSEIGHITIDIDASTGSAGNTGTAESVCGRDAIVTRARRRLERGRDSAMFDLCNGDMTQLTPRLVAEAAAAGDDAAREVWEETAWYLSAVIVNVVFTCDIERVVIAGGVAQAGETLFAPLRRAVAARTSMLPFDTNQIVAAELGPQAGLIGAAQWARERVAELQ